MQKHFAMFWKQRNELRVKSFDAKVKSLRERKETGGWHGNRKSVKEDEALDTKLHTAKLNKTEYKLWAALKDSKKGNQNHNHDI